MLRCERAEREPYAEAIHCELAIISRQGINSHSEMV